MTQLAMAERLGVSRQAVSLWLLGERRPNALQRHAIEVMSGGAIVSTDWLLPAEVAAVERVR